MAKRPDRVGAWILYRTLEDVSSIVVWPVGSLQRRPADFGFCYFHFRKMLVGVDDQWADLDNWVYDKMHVRCWVSSERRPIL